MKVFQVSLFMCLVCGPAVFASVPTQVGVQAIGENRYEVDLKTQVSAAPEALWRVLTDYNHHAGFLPYMMLSRTVPGDPSFIWVEQEGRIRILLWTFTMRVKQKVLEHPIEHMHFEAVEGDFKNLAGDWDLSRVSSRQTGLRCRFIVEPKRRVPEWAVRLAAKHYLAAMVKRLQERAEQS